MNEVVRSGSRERSAVEAGEEAAGAGEVAGDLGAEGVGGGEFAFVTETLPEVNLHWSGRNNL